MTSVSAAIGREERGITPKISSPLKGKTENTQSIFNEQNNTTNKEDNYNLDLDESLKEIRKEIKKLETLKKEKLRNQFKEKVTPGNIEKAKEKVNEILNKDNILTEYNSIDELTDEEIILACSDRNTTKAIEKEFRKFFNYNDAGLGKLHQRLIEISEKYGVEPYGGKNEYIKTPTPEMGKLYGVPIKYRKLDGEETYYISHKNMFRQHINYEELLNKMALKILNT